MKAWLHQTFARFAALFRGRELDTDLDEDLATHLELLTDEYVGRGMDRQAARREARLRFGSVVSALELHRDVRSMRWIEILGSETGWAWRGVRARGWKAALVVSLLGVALAANTIVFSAADAFVFRRAPYADSSRLVILQYHSPFGPRSVFHAPAIVEWRRQRDVLGAVEAHTLDAPVYVTAGGITDSIRAERVTSGMFGLLGAAPRWGRPLVPDDARSGATPVALVAEDIATRVFGTAGQAVGQKLETPDGPVVIVGVMPATFRFPTARERIWRPLRVEGQDRRAGYSTIARLAPGVPFDQAAAAVAQRALAIATKRRDPP
ncbi:MAG: ABC transporter permease [Vicinamibacterales bacterium]